MSEFDRAVRLGRAYGNKMRDTMFPGESPESRAVKELNEALESGVQLKKTEVAEFKQYVEAMTTEEARIVLGVSNEAQYSQVKAQHELLTKHLDNFEKTYPDKKAIAVRERDRVKKAFALLSSAVDSTEKRFGSLEID